MTYQRKLPLAFLSLSLFTDLALGQNVAIFPDEYIAVPEGPFNSPNLPLANGTSRVQCLYEAIDIAVPSGHSITKLGFRQDGDLTTMDTGRIINLEIRMGYTTLTAATMSTTYATNYATPPVTVFGPANITLPNLRDISNPLPNGQFFVTLSTPFSYVPAGQNLIVEYRCFGNSGGGSPFNYRLDRANFYSPIVSGPAGCPHSGGGTPNLTVQPLAQGMSYTASATACPGNSPGLLAVSLGTSLATPFPLNAVFAGVNPLCTGQVSPQNLLTPNIQSDGSGNMNLSFTVPNNPVFADLLITSQALFLDLFAPGGLVVSNGVQVQVGARTRSSILHAAGAPTSVTTGSVNANYCPVAFFEYQ